MQSDDQRTSPSKDVVADALRQLLQADPSLRETILGSLGEKQDTEKDPAIEKSAAVTSDAGSTATPTDSDSEQTAPTNRYIPPPPGLELNAQMDTAIAASSPSFALPAPPSMDKAAKDLQAAIANLQVAADAFQNEQKRLQEERVQQEQQTHAAAQASVLAAADAAKKVAESLTTTPPLVANAFELHQQQHREQHHQQRSRLSISAPAYVPAAAGGGSAWFPSSAAFPSCWPHVPQFQQWDALSATPPATHIKHWPDAPSKTATKICSSARTATGIRPKDHVGAFKEEEKEDTLRTHLQELEAKDPERIIIARKINRLGFDSPEILKIHFGQYGVVEDVLVSHSHVRCQNGNAATRLRPSGLGFIVMENAEDAQAIQAHGEHHRVADAMIRLYPFKKRIALADGLED